MLSDAVYFGETPHCVRGSVYDLQSPLTAEAVAFVEPTFDLSAHCVSVQ